MLADEINIYNKYIYYIYQNSSGSWKKDLKVIIVAYTKPPPTKDIIIAGIPIIAL